MQLDPNKQANEVIFLENQTTALIPVNVQRKAIQTLNKSFIRPHVDYGDILYDKPENESFLNKSEKF